VVRTWRPWRIPAAAGLDRPALNHRESDFWNLFSWQNFSNNFATFSTLSPSHHIKYIKRHMFEAVDVAKKIN
jgi:hypothetical protein